MEVHTLEIKKHYEKMKEEMKIIEDLRLMETSSYYGNDEVESKMFNPKTNTFFSVDAYDFETKKVILFCSKLNQDHEQYDHFYEKFDDYFLELSFKEYSKDYLKYMAYRKEAQELIDTL